MLARQQKIHLLFHNHGEISLYQNQLNFIDRKNKNLKNTPPDNALYTQETESK